MCYNWVWAVSSSNSGRNLEQPRLRTRLPSWSTTTSLHWTLVGDMWVWLGCGSVDQWTTSLALLRCWKVQDFVLPIGVIDQEKAPCPVSWDGASNNSDSWFPVKVGLWVGPGFPLLFQIFPNKFSRCTNRRRRSGGCLWIFWHHRSLSSSSHSDRS